MAVNEVRVQHGTVRYGAVRYGTVRYGTVRRWIPVLTVPVTLHGSMGYMGCPTAFKQDS